MSACSLFVYYLSLVSVKWGQYKDKYLQSSIHGFRCKLIILEV